MTFHLRLLLLCSAIGLGFSTPVQANEIKVVVTTNILADSIRNVLPKPFNVISLMDSGIDPHLYRATHGDIKRLLEADLIVYNGKHLEGRMQEPLEKMARKKKVLIITDAFPNKQFIQVGPNQADPHIWMDVTLWIQGLDYLVAQISQQYPKHTSTIQAKWLDYQTQLKQLHQTIKDQVQTIPKSQRILITAHDAFAYFGQQYQFEVDALQGISTISEFGLKDIKRLKQKIIKHNLKAIFVESTISPRFIQSLQAGLAADQHSVELGGTLHSDSLDVKGTEASTYIGMMRHNAKTITQALTDAAP